jgi:PIN domain nuclease of toxin-antitoxin system
MAAVIYLDTNVVVWLAGAPDELSDTAREQIRAATDLRISPMVELEIEYLHEIGRLRHPAAAVLAHLRAGLELRSCDKPFVAIVEVAGRLKWTRDPFDRIIVAHAALDASPLLTRDRIIQANYPHAVW